MIEWNEKLIERVEGDIRTIKELTKISNPKKITIFTSPQWKWKGLQLTHQSIGEKPDFGKIMKELMANPELKKHGGEVPTFAKQALKVALEFKTIPQIEEEKILKNSKEYFEQKLNCKIDIISAEKSEHPKAKNAFPFKPAILIE